MVGEKMEKYAYNKRDGDFTNKTFYEARMKHTFEEHCQVLWDLNSYFVGASVAFLLVLVVWCLFVFSIRKE